MSGRNKMGKRIAELYKKVDAKKRYALDEAAKIVKDAAKAKFDETIELHVKLGIDPKQTDQTVRGTVVLPAGTGKTKKIAVVAKGEKLKEAETAGADFFGDADIIEKMQKGWMDFDVIVATPDAMKDLSKLGKVLGPKGLMPNPKAGTVTFEVARAVKELKGGRIEFKNDDFGIVHTIVGKASFTSDKIAENVRALMSTLIKAKPASAKGSYLRSISLSSTMGPGISLDTNQKFTATV
ncbi:MAG: 50S ribosomal protein L1 [Elusimicrobia bacterium RIFCSPLOWO2_01_FULL_54_10]|nr:MAG: 50S ribosomal protein L1 [Elusimicrobia bacterium RIFCSPLOWO2_01_FULL_54_10]